jgi:hypothetical protein
MSDVIISLTTIPPRMTRLGPTLDSLLKQTATISSIILWLPKKYRRDAFNDYSAPKVPLGVEIRYCDIDYGPATKILPAVSFFKGQDVKLIYCDDDEIYDPDWAELLVSQSEQFPSECISIVGMTVERIEYDYFKRTWPYHLRNILTLGFYRRWYLRQAATMKSKPGLVDICQGFGGVLVKPEFFPATAFDIPDVLWTVDDVWLAGQMRANGVRVRRAAEIKKCQQSDAAHVERLTTLVHDGYDRVAADMYCVNYFREKYGIWKKPI